MFCLATNNADITLLPVGDENEHSLDCMIVARMIILGVRRTLAHTSPQEEET
jgi:hypothetical protein